MRVFFFSSRRRHTRYWRDWSSDVCSSDLRPPTLAGRPTVARQANQTSISDSIRNKKTLASVAVALAGAFALNSCETATGTGALVGAGAGALIGGQSGGGYHGHSRSGALAGAAIGA